VSIRCRQKIQRRYSTQLPRYEFDSSSCSPYRSSAICILSSHTRRRSSWRAQPNTRRAKRGRVSLSGFDEVRRGHCDNLRSPACWGPHECRHWHCRDPMNARAFDSVTCRFSFGLLCDKRRQIHSHVSSPNIRGCGRVVKLTCVSRLDSQLQHWRVGGESWGF
jgi:hypothetical protein